MVERFPGTKEVPGSIPGVGSQFGVQYEHGGEIHVEEEITFWTQEEAQEYADGFRRDVELNYSYEVSKGNTPTDPKSIKVVSRLVTPWSLPYE